MPEPGMRHMGAEVRMVIRGESLAHRLLRSRLMFLLVATLVLDAVATALMYMLEHDARGSGFDDLGGALFWVSAQLTTVSSQMPNPVTTPGRVIDIVLEVWAISAVAALAGAMGAFFVARHHESPRRPDAPAEPR
jgi:protein-S-isoprenylcysteine O-methyltransferase Ste14